MYGAWPTSARLVSCSACSFFTGMFTLESMYATFVWTLRHLSAGQRVDVPLDDLCRATRERARLEDDVGILLAYPRDQPQAIADERQVEHAIRPHDLVAHRPAVTVLRRLGDVDDAGNEVGRGENRFGRRTEVERRSVHAVVEAPLIERSRPVSIRRPELELRR